MLRYTGVGLLVVGVALLAGGVAAWAEENKGQEDLDKATELQVTAQSLGDLEKVIQLTEDAIKKGLDAGNEQFAKQLLSSTLFQHAERLCGPIFAQNPPDQRWPMLRRFALRDLERAIEVDPKLADAHMLIGRLHTLPGGDRERALKGLNGAISLLDEDPKRRAEALVYRAQIREKIEDRLKDYELAIKADPSNTEAWQQQAVSYMEQGKLEEAVASLQKLLAEHADNVEARLALAEALTNLDKADEARQEIDKALELKPDSALAYTLRARIHLLKDDSKAALDDLDQALKLQPRDLSALLVRARVYLADDKFDEANEDVERVLLLSPGLPQGLLLRSLISANRGRMSDAIADVRQVLDQNPENVALQLQLASYYVQDKRPTKAIEIFTKILAKDEDNVQARQARGDTLLSVGKHAEAVEDFELVLKAAPESDSLLNNFAWVLATSPDDKVRNGKRAIELATKACEVTEYKKPHILSTLASAYAESGDFETAMKWSSKAVELGAKDKEVDEQLKKELESYKQKKPWREKQTVEEKPDSLQERRAGFET